MGKRKNHNSLSRRDFLRRVGATAALPALTACGGSGSSGFQANASAGIAAATGGGTSSNPFQHGVASGDPLSNAVIIWTRITTSQVGPITVSWEMALDPEMTTIVRTGTLTTDSTRDWTVKVDVTSLFQDTAYYYRFSALGETSFIARTRTAPAPTTVTTRLRFAVVSCASFPHGFFNAYRRVAERQDLQAVIHLGDYIYEYGNGPGEYGADVQAGGRVYDPPYEMVTLSDYRRRHAMYKQDEDLMAMHQQHPLIHVWDDHEFTDNTYRDGAKNHNPTNQYDPDDPSKTEGAWVPRSLAALQAYFEWMPTRDPLPVDPPERIYRRFQFGDLVDLIMLDTRFTGRDEEIEPNGAPVPGAGFTTFTHSGDFVDPNLRLIGDDQLTFLTDALQNSTAQWKLLGQQIMFGQLKFQGAPNALGTSQFLNPDQWDGYPAERQRVYDIIRGGAAAPNVAINDIVVLTGDIHTAWSMDITEDPNNPVTATGGYNPATGENSMAVEFVATSVSSPGLDILEGSANAPLMTQNPHMKYINLADHGYLLLDIDTNRAQGEHWLVDDILAPNDGESMADARLSVSGNNRLTAGTQSTPIPNPPDFAPTS